MKDRLSAVSLFAGAGGMDIGAIQAGFDLHACIEIDPYACATLRTNRDNEHRRTTVLERDVRTVDPLELASQIAIEPGSLSLLMGGPPCQTFSQIGKQAGITDERGLLLFEMVRFASALLPHTILVENVKGLLSAKGHKEIPGEVFALLVHEFEKIGYDVHWQVMNAASFGAAELRERVFIVATRDGLGFEFPQPSHARDGCSNSLFSLLPFATVGDAIAGLDEPSQKGKSLRTDSHVDVTPAGDRARIKGVPEGGFLAAQLHLPVEQRKNLQRKDTTKFLRTSRSSPSNTLRCGEIFFHPTEDRYLTPREYMRIHGFPDEYVLRGPIRGRSGSVRNLDQHRQVANSVVPPVARAIATEIKKYLHAKNIRAVRISA